MKYKKILSFTLSTLLLLHLSAYVESNTIISYAAVKANTTVIPIGNSLLSDGYISNKCGDNIRWSLDSNGTLSVRGTGTMYNYKTTGNSLSSDGYASNMPWSEYKDEIRNVVISDGVTSIGNHAFWNCTKLSSVAIPKTVKTIGDGAFGSCDSLSAINIPDSVEHIGDSVFTDCSSLTEIIIPDNVSYMGMCVFYYCTSLKSIQLPSKMQYLPFGFLLGCSNLSSITLPKSIKRIEDTSLSATNISTIEIPDSVEELKFGAFDYCISLESITLPKSVNKIERDAFCQCSSLQSVTILNPDCEIEDSDSTFCNEYNFSKPDQRVCTMILKGYVGSTAQLYARKYNVKFEIIDDNAVKDDPIISKYGDIDDNGSVDVTDLSRLSIHLVDKTFFTEKEEKAADVTGDDQVNLSDLAHLRQYLSKKINWLGVESK